MPKHHKTLTRSLAAVLAVCAIAPGMALAVPATNWPGVSPNSAPPAAASGGPGVTAEDYRSLDYRAPVQTDGRGTGGVAAPTAPQWPVNPQPLTRPHAVAAAKPSNDGGVDTGAWIALGAAALMVAAGIGVAGAKRVRTGGHGQPA
jgi:hypothetical protein